MVELKARLRGAAIEDQDHGTSEVFLDMARAGGADAARKVGAGRGDGNAGGGDKLARSRVRGDADRERIEAGGDKLANAAGRAGPLRQDKRQRPRPKLFRQGQRLAVELNEIARGVEAFHMRDQRIESAAGPSPRKFARPPFRWWHRRPGRTPSRSETRRGRQARKIRAASAIAPSSALTIIPKPFVAVGGDGLNAHSRDRRKSISAKNVCLCMWLPWVPAFAGTTLRLLI